MDGISTAFAEFPEKSPSGAAALPGTGISYERTMEIPGMVWYNNRKIPITQEGTAVKWFHDMSEQEKQSFKKVIAVCAAGAAFILLIPAVFSLLG